MFVVSYTNIHGHQSHLYLILVYIQTLTQLHYGRFTSTLTITLVQTSVVNVHTCPLYNVLVL